MRTGAKDVRFRAISCEVTVVPIFAPIMMPSDAANEMMPALTRPTAITVVAVLDWTNAVTSVPIKVPRTACV